MTGNKIRCIIGFLIFSFIISCSTPYQPKGLLGGYVSETIDDHSLKASFYGNQHTDPEIIRTYLYYYCAELTIQNGYEYFHVSSDQSYYDVSKFRADPDQPAKTTKTKSGGINTRVIPSFSRDTSTPSYVGEFVISMYAERVPGHTQDLLYAPQVLTELEHNIKKE